MATATSPTNETHTKTSTADTSAAADTRKDADARLRLASKLASALPGEVHFVVTPVPFSEDVTMQKVVRLMDERMDHMAHIPCAGLSRTEVLDQIDVAGAVLASYEWRFLRLGIVCTDLPWGSGDYLSSLNESIEDLRAIGAAMVASMAPEGERMLDSMGEHERHFPLDYHGPIEPTPQTLERRKAAQRQPFDLLLSLCLPALMTVDEAASLIRVSPERLRRLIRRGEVEGAMYVGTKLRIHTNALLRQYGISAREALPNFMDPLGYLFEAYVEGRGAQDAARDHVAV